MTDTPFTPLEIKAAVDDIGYAYEAFKDSNDANQKKHDAVLTDKVERINDDVARLQDKLDKMHIAMKRSAMALSTPEAAYDAHEYKQAFMSYVRKGQDDDLHTLATKALSVSTPDDGGHFVPKIISDTLSQYIFSISPMRQLATTMTVTTDALDMVVDFQEPAVAWVAETAARNETNTPQIKNVKITAHELYAEPRCTQKLLDDAQFDVESWLIQKIADKMAREENAAFIAGDGTGKPKGITTYTVGTSYGQIEAYKTGVNGAWPASNPADLLITTYLGLKAEYAQDAAWLMNRAVLSGIRKFKTQDNNYLWTPTLEVGKPAHLLGFPVYIADDMPALGTGSLSVAFGNFKAAYTIVDRFGLRLLRDPYTTKPYVKFYASKRVGGEVTNFEALKFVQFAV